MIGAIKKLFGIKSPKLVLCLNFSGVIGKDSKFDPGLSFKSLQPAIESAFANKNAAAIAIAINSPGGSPVQSELIYNYIREQSSLKKIPVYTFAQDVAASGGYWLLLSGDEIYAHNSSIVGSIGVLFSGFGFVELAKKIGVSRRIYTEGEQKALLDPFLPEDERGIEMLKSAQRDVFESFKFIVKARREEKIKANDDEIFTGAFWSGKKAFELGLIDGICDMRVKLKEKFGQDVKIVYLSKKEGWLKSLLKSSFSEKLLNKLEEKIEFSKYGVNK